MLVPPFRDAHALLLGRILPGVVGITVATGGLRWLLDERGVLRHTTSVVLMTAVSVALFTVLAFWVAHVFDQLASREQKATRDDLYRLLARSYPDGGTYLFDCDLRYLLVEGRNLEQVDVKPEAFEGHLIWEVLTAEEAAQVEPAYRAALAGETHTFEMLYRNEHYSATVGPTRNEHGAIVGGLALTQRITEQKQLREQFHQLQKMDAIGQLAGGIAHDFNNLLVAIRGYAEMVRNKPEDPKARNWLDEVVKASDRASTLTRQLLAFSRQEVFTPDVVSLNALIQDTINMLEQLVGAHIRIVTDLDPRLGLTRIDTGQINQILVNLVVNARDAMPEGGTITIRTASVVLNEEYARRRVGTEPGAYAHISLSDTGVGMDSETLARLYEPFYTTKERGTGTGLGLSTVYGIVKQSGGHIEVTSEKNRGTTFDVYLPYHCTNPADS